MSDEQQTGSGEAPVAKTVSESAATTKSEAGFKKVVPVNARGNFGRFKPDIYWYTPILVILAAIALAFALKRLFIKLARSAESRRWNEETRRQAYADRPFRTGPPDTSSSGPV